MKRAQVMAALACFSLLTAGMCSTQTKVETVPVTLPVPVPCAQTLGPEPEYPDSETALQAAPNIFEWVKLMKAGRLLRIARAAEYAAAIEACRIVS